MSDLGDPDHPAGDVGVEHVRREKLGAALRALTEARTRARVLEILVAALVDLGADAALAAYLDDDRLAGVASQGLPAEFVDLSIRSYGRSLGARVVSLGEPAYVGDLEREVSPVGPLREPLLALGVRALSLYPARNGAAVAGLFAEYRRAPGAVSAAQRFDLSLLSSTLGACLAAAKGNEERREARRRDRLLQHVVARLSAAQPHALARQLVHGAVAEGALGCAIFLDGQGAQLQLAALESAPPLARSRAFAESAASLARALPTDEALSKLSRARVTPLANDTVERAHFEALASDGGGPLVPSETAMATFLASTYLRGTFATPLELAASAPPGLDEAATKIAAFLGTPFGAAAPLVALGRRVGYLALGGAEPRATDADARALAERTSPLFLAATALERAEALAEGAEEDRPAPKRRG